MLRTYDFLGVARHSGDHGERFTTIGDFDKAERVCFEVAEILLYGHEFPQDSSPVPQRE